MSHSSIKRGDIVLTYAKVHTCEFDLESAVTPGDGGPVVALETGKGTVKIGLVIRYDREFPESARILMLRGAELILTPNACTLDEHRIGQFKARAFENMVGVAMSNYAAPQNNGHSVAFDAVAYPVVDGDMRDTKIIEAGEDEGIFICYFRHGQHSFISRARNMGKLLPPAPPLSTAHRFNR